MEHVWNILGEALPAIETALAALLSWAAIELTRWIRAHTANTIVSGILTRLTDVVRQVVADVAQTAADDLKRATSPDSPGGRKITADEAAGLKADAIAKVKSYLGPKGIALLMKTSGIRSASALDDMIGSKIEAEVRALKTPGGLILKGGRDPADATPSTPPGGAQ
jgi:hypothetical protein